MRKHHVVVAAANTHPLYIHIACGIYVCAWLSWILYSTITDHSAIHHLTKWSNIAHLVLPLAILLRFEHIFQRYLAIALMAQQTAVAIGSMLLVLYKADLIVESRHEYGLGFVIVGNFLLHFMPFLVDAAYIWARFDTISVEASDPFRLYAFRYTSIQALLACVSPSYTLFYAIFNPSVTDTYGLYILTNFQIFSIFVSVELVVHILLFYFLFVSVRSATPDESKLV